MVIDTSALVAVLTGEPEVLELIAAIGADDVRLLSAASFVETSIVLEARYGGEGVRLLDVFLERAAVEISAVDHEQARVARDAFAQFGKGRHRAALNFGDCFAYALAMTSGEPLLFNGDDFAHTDVQRVSGMPKS